MAYIASWSDEQTEPVRVVERPRYGIGFADERLTDRDRAGVLWTRTPSLPGSGRPRFERVHPLRQRRAMRKLLCQVCAEPADITDQGALWLLTDYRDDWPNWPESMGNTHPPLCVPCARASVLVCPALRRGYVAVRARSEIAGVYGVRYVAGAPGPVPVGDVTVRYDDPTIRWVLANQLVRTLHDCTVVDLECLSAE